MHPKFITCSEKKIVGMKSSMHHNQFESIVSLWKRFMPRKKEINTILNNKLIAMQVYSDFNDTEKPFDIWAGVEVSNLDNVPEGMISFLIEEADYAVFVHKGMDAAKTYQRIMSEWLPNSGYEIAERPHFQIMGDRYKNGSATSEEDFYIPIRLKG
jgi:AraC family transcriptional regulator